MLYRSKIPYFNCGLIKIIFEVYFNLHSIWINYICKFRGFAIINFNVLAWNAVNILIFKGGCYLLTTPSSDVSNWEQFFLVVTYFIILFFWSIQNTFSKYNSIKIRIFHEEGDTGLFNLLFFFNFDWLVY